MPPPLLAVTMGDPAGVGPEICLRLLANPNAAPDCLPTVYGSAAVLRHAAAAIGCPLQAPVIPDRDWSPERARAAGPCVRDIAFDGEEEVEAGRLSAACAAAGYAFFSAAIDAAASGEVHGIVTAPLNKEALRAAGIPFSGHTEILADRFDAPRSCMMQYSDEITCTFVTVHVGYADVPTLLTTVRILDVIDLTRDALRRIRGREPRLVVCGLNPHAGERGLFGNGEEERVIAPAVAAARAAGADIDGPIPPDTAFIPARRAATDAFVCMYHDQGHIPLKALAFDKAVNTTLGLPIIRTSVDHGTAFDIAWQGKANPSSLIEAVKLAARILKPR